jgi:predicted Ser/Thr protein kinase
MKEVIEKIDPSLEYKRKLWPSRTLVYKVEKGGETYVLKFVRADDEWGVKHLDREREVLALAKDLPGVTHLVQAYKDLDDYKNPLLKEFYVGETLEELGEEIKDAGVQKKIEETVRGLHSLGVAELDLNRRCNVVLSPDKKEVCLIDLGYGVLSKETSSLEFERMKSRDYSHLEKHLFS